MIPSPPHNVQWVAGWLRLTVVFFAAHQGGEVIKNIRDTTGAKVKLENLVPGFTDRVITISSEDR